MHDRTAGIAHQLDVLVGHPDRMRDRRARMQQAEIVHVADQGLAVELGSGHRLRLGLQDMGVEGRPDRPRQLVGGQHQLLGAALRRRRRDHETQAAGAIVEARSRFLAEGEIVVEPRRRQRVRLGLEVGGDHLVGKGDRVEEWPVHDVARDVGAQPDIVIGLEDLPKLVERLAAQFVDVVDQGGDAVPERFHRHHHRPQIDQPVGRRRGAQDGIAIEHPELERHVVVAALEQCLAGVQVPVY